MAVYTGSGQSQEKGLYKVSYHFVFPDLIVDRERGEGAEAWSHEEMVKHIFKAAMQLFLDWATVLPLYRIRARCTGLARTLPLSLPIAPDVQIWRDRPR